MFSTKKAQGMSLNTVIIAIIVLVVLVVLVMIFTGYFGKVFTPTVASCNTAGGECKEGATASAACGNDATGKPIGTVAGAKCTVAAEAAAQQCCQRHDSSAFA